MKYLNNIIEDSYSLFTRIKSGVRTAGLVALVGAMIGVGVYGCKKQGPSRIFPYEAAELAKEVVGAPYLGDGITWGGKGYDCCLRQFVDSNEIKISGYCYCDGRIKKCNEEKATGVDCSGLVFWSYNRTYFGNKELTWRDLKNAPISALYSEGADGQYRGNSQPIAKEELAPGDLLFYIPSRDKRKKVEHVMMYVGPFIYEDEEYNVVHASGFTGTITPANYNSNTEKVFTQKNGGQEQYLPIIDYGRVVDYELDIEITDNPPMSDGNIASFVFTCEDQNDVTLTLPPPTLTGIGDK